MAQLVWSDQYELGVPQMDRNHQEFAQLQCELVQAGDDRFLALLDAFIAHTEDHFAQENAWMEASGFPPIHCHRGEHDRVLEVLRDVRKRAAGGDIALGRTLANELAPWFDAHAATMDAALAYFIKQSGYRIEAEAGAAAANPCL